MTRAAESAPANHYDAALCEACQIYHDQLFDEFCGNGFVPDKSTLKKLERSVCRTEDFWHLSTNAHSDEFKNACHTVHEAKTYELWKEYEAMELHCSDFPSHQNLAHVKRLACVEKLGACPEEVLPKIDRRATDCEKCAAVVYKLSGVMWRHDLDQVSDYRIEGLVSKALEDRKFCSTLGKDFYEPPGSDTGNEKDYEQYCLLLIHLHPQRLYGAFKEHRGNVKAVLKDACPQPNCDLPISPKAEL